MSLAEFQAFAVKIRAERGFTRDSNRILTLLVEEIGEVARELKRMWSPNYGAFSAERLGDELADVLVLVLAMADAHGIDLEAARIAKLQRDGLRAWRSASPPDSGRGERRPGVDLNGVCQQNFGHQSEVTD